MTAGTPSIDLFVAPELGNTSFLVADPDSGEAIVIDPLRDVDQYLARAEHAHFRIGHALETHVHNDFVSGARELEREVGARIGAAADSGLEFPFDGLREGHELRVGRWCLKVRHTPGHTPAHLSYLLQDEAGQPVALFSGGALMVGTAARTDLLGPEFAVPLARESFRTLHERLRGLPDELAVYPTHGGGSFCGSATSDKRTTTLGDERRTNPLLQEGELLPFIARVLTQGPYPAYYRLMAPLNRHGAPLVGRQLPALRQLTAEEVRQQHASGAAVVDVRLPREYDREHIPGSYNIGNDAFSAWVGWILPPERPLILTGGTRERHVEAQRQLFRIGYDRVLGELDGGMDEWRAASYDVSAFETADIDELARRLVSGEPMTVLDVRDEDEWVHGHVPGAVHMTVPEVQQHAHSLPHDAPLVVHCALGYRAGIAASLLEQAGITKIIRVEGGYPDWEARHLPAVIPG